jgi:membrane fusion protein, multidrug efflux system
MSDPPGRTPPHPADAREETPEARPPDARTPGEPRSSRTRWLIAAGIAILIILILVRVLLGSKQPTRGPAPQVVNVAQAVRGDMPETLSELGTVTPLATITVLPQLSGYLTQVGYQEGQDVTKGQFLAQIDPRPYQIALAQAQAAAIKDQASLSQARVDLARYQLLRSKNAIAEQTVVDQGFLVKQLEGQVAADQANIQMYRLDLEYCHITAPVAGRVGLRLVDPGNYVTASSTPGIVVITTMKPTTVQFTVAQNNLGLILQRVQSGAKLPVTVYSSDNTRELATGTLFAISNQMATSTGTVTLRASFPNENEVLFPNEFVNVKLLVDTLKQALLIPTPAVLNGAPGTYVYLVNPNHTVSVHPISSGPSDGVDTAVLSGLSVGDTVVINGTDRLTDGARINIAESPPSATPTGTAAQPQNTRAPGANARGANPRGPNARGASAPPATSASPGR